PSLYYHPNGHLAKTIPYSKDLIHGIRVEYNANGELIKQTSYDKGVKEGECVGFWAPGVLSYRETYKADLLLSGTYYQPDQTILTEVKEGLGKQAIFKEGKLFSLVQFQKGVPEGSVEVFNEEGALISLHHIKEGKKNGEEWGYYPASKGASLKPKICIPWEEDVIQGVVKTWYENGAQESQR